MKRCSKCGIEKELSEFYKNIKSADGYLQQCKCCRKNYSEENKEKIKISRQLYHLRNKDILSERRKRWGEENKDYPKEYYKKNKTNILKKQKEYYKDNIETIRPKEKAYRDKTKEKMRAYSKDYLARNSDRKKEYLKKYVKENRKKINEYYRDKTVNDIKHKTKKNINSSFRRVFKKYSINSKSKKFFEYSGVSLELYFLYFSSRYSQELELYLNKGEYHIDHIIPCALYDFSDEEEIKKCWQPENLRIIPAEENLSKSGKLDMDLVIEHNIQHLLPKKIQRRSA
jgi:hypothetical protein